VAAPDKLSRQEREITDLFYSIYKLLGVECTLTNLYENVRTMGVRISFLASQFVDAMTSKDLGRSQSREMVKRYTRSVTFQDSLKFY